MMYSFIRNRYRAIDEKNATKKTDEKSTKKTEIMGDRESMYPVRDNQSGINNDINKSYIYIADVGSRGDCKRDCKEERCYEENLS